jgi:hypothetical protein
MGLYASFPAFATWSWKNRNFRDISAYRFTCKKNQIHDDDLNHY